MTQLENKENPSEKQIVSKEKLDGNKLPGEKKDIGTEVNNELKTVEAKVVENEAKQKTDQLDHEIDFEKTKIEEI